AQAPLSKRASMMTAGFHPPANGIPLSGSTTKRPTALGTTAPKRRARVQYAAPFACRSRGERTTPQIPPQKARQTTAGTPSGGTRVMSYGHDFQGLPDQPGLPMMVDAVGKDAMVLGAGRDNGSQAAGTTRLDGADLRQRGHDRNRARATAASGRAAGGWLVVPSTAVIRQRSGRQAACGAES